MPLHPLRHLLTASAVAATLYASTAAAADYTTITLHIDVDRAVNVVWKKIGGYCDISAWLKMTCVYTSGSGDLGSMRRLNDRIDEVMVAKTAYSYTYTQPASTRPVPRHPRSGPRGQEEIPDQLHSLL